MQIWYNCNPWWSLSPWIPQPQSRRQPVYKAAQTPYQRLTFWFEHWGRSRTESDRFFSFVSTTPQHFSPTSDSFIGLQQRNKIQMRFSHSLSTKTLYLTKGLSLCVFWSVVMFDSPNYYLLHLAYNIRIILKIFR